MQELLLRMLAASLRRNIHDASLEKLEHGLLHALSRHVTRNGRIVALAGYLVNLVNEHDSPLGLCDIIVCLLQKT